MIDSMLLREKIIGSGLKITFIAQRCGLTYQGFLNKLNNESEFKTSEVATLRNLLNLSDDEVNAIFFAFEVA